MICNLFSEPSYIFYSTQVPALLYYAHVPAVIIGLLFGIYVFLNNKHLLGRLLLAISILFTTWTVLAIITWTNIHSDILLFVWSFLGTLLGLIAISCVYFTYVFVENKDVPLRTKGIFLALLSPLIIFAPTIFNLSGFDITNCDAFQFEWLPYKVYSASIGFLAMIWILILLIRKYRTAQIQFKKQLIMMGIGIEALLFLFFGMEFLAAFLTRIGTLPDSGIEIYGMFGMVIFILYINILIVRFNAFKVKLIATQSFVVGLTTLIGTQLFFIKQPINFVLTSITFVASAILGFFLIRSVKREIKNKEEAKDLATKLSQTADRLAATNEKLQELNKQKTEFVSIASHQLRTPLTAIKGYSSLLLEGSYGNLPPTIKDPIEKIFESSQRLVNIIEDFLNITRIELGRMKYEAIEFDLKEVAQRILEEPKPMARRKNLILENNFQEGNYKMTGDSGKLGQVISNLLDNAFKYTSRGNIVLSLSKPKPQTILISIKDTGIGISKETLPKLFEKFIRSDDAGKTNISGTGLGLYVARQIVEAHKGKIWAESAGKGKGSTFFVELPIK